MKVKVERIEPGFSLFGGGALRLTSGPYVLVFNIPQLTAKKIARVLEPDKIDPTEDRCTIEDLMGDQIKNLEIEELYLNHINDEGEYYSQLTMGGVEHTMVPSEALLLSVIAGSPIFFETEMKGVKNQDDPEEDEDEGCSCCGDPCPV